MDRRALFALCCSALLVSAAYLAGFGTVATFTDRATADGNVSSAAEFADDVTVVDAAANSQSTSDGSSADQQCGSGGAGNAAGNTETDSAGNTSSGGGLAGCGGSGGNDGTDGGRYVAPAARPLTVGGRR
ncbi:hypothetical protein [Haloarchaeobius baliensis]|uniref:hypothetical protein n=1 Tax=Haloarchaeobius baliensis TaxID=1670458 RepID=UPI003F8846D9